VDAISPALASEQQVSHPAVDTSSSPFGANAIPSAPGFGWQVHDSMPGSSALALATQNPASTAAPAPSSPTRPHTRLRDGIRKPKVYIDGTICYGCLATATSEPRNINEALGNENWKEAMDSEFHALLKNKTWHLVPPQ
jgi:hypothetical protein